MNESLQALEKRFPEVYNWMNQDSTSEWTRCQTDLGEENLKKQVNGETVYLHSPFGARQEAKDLAEQLLTPDRKYLFFYGIGLGYFFNELDSWLNEDSDRRVIFFEEDQTVFQCFLETSNAIKIIRNPQVFILPYSDKTPMNDIFKILKKTLRVNEFIHFNQKGIFGALPIYRASTSFQILNRKLLACGFILMRAEDVFLLSEIVFRNYTGNYLSSNRFYRSLEMKDSLNGIPVVICAAGPSLEYSLDVIREIQDYCLLVAVGTALNILTHHHIQPHIFVGIDPTVNSYSRILQQTSFDLPFFFQDRMNWKSVSSLQGPPLVLKRPVIPDQIEDHSKLDKGGDEQWAGWSVSNLAIHTLRMLGAGPTLLVGMDLVYSKDRMYAAGMKEQPIIQATRAWYEHKHFDMTEKNAIGETVRTTEQFLFERNWVNNFLKENNEWEVWNATQEGLIIEGAPYLSIAKFKDRYLTTPFDVKGFVHQAIQSTTQSELSLSSCLKKLQKWMQEMTSIENDLGHEEDFEKILDTVQSYSVWDTFLKSNDDHLQLLFKKRQSQWPSVSSEEELQERNDEERKACILKNCKRAAEAFQKVINQWKWYNEEVSTGGQPNAEFHGDESSFSTDHLEKKETLNVEGKVKWRRFYRDQDLDGPSTYFHENGNVLSQTLFKEGKKQGKAKFFYPSGALYSTEQYDKGKPHGIWESFYENGQLKSRYEYDHGLLDGEITEYYPSGNKKREIHFLDGKREGLDTYWYTNGQKMFELNYDYDDPIGIGYLWFPDGKVKVKGKFNELGKMDYMFQWDEEGEVVKSSTMNTLLKESIQHIKKIKISLEEVRKGSGRPSLEQLQNISDEFKQTGQFLDGSDSF